VEIVSNMLSMIARLHSFLCIRFLNFNRFRRSPSDPALLCLSTDFLVAASCSDIEYICPADATARHRLTTRISKRRARSARWGVGEHPRPSMCLQRVPGRQWLLSGSALPVGSASRRIRISARGCILPPEFGPRPPERLSVGKNWRRQSARRRYLPVGINVAFRRQIGFYVAFVF